VYRFKLTLKSLSVCPSIENAWTYFKSEFCTSEQKKKFT